MPTRSVAYAAFRTRLKQARLAAGLTQGQAAQRLGKPQSYVSKCESGERRVDVVELAAFARVYGVRLPFFADRPTTAVAENSAPYRRAGTRRKARGKG